MDYSDLEKAALEAELATGTRESTEAAAKSHVVLRLARMSFGAVLCVGGLAMIVLPGPGMVVLAAGLVILAEDVAWADRALRYVRKRTPGVPEDGAIPRSTILVSSFLGAAGILVSLWWFLLR